MWDFYLINVTDASEAEIRIVFRRYSFFLSFIKIYRTETVRNIEYHLFGTFLQQTALLLVGYLTFYFEISDFTVSVTVSNCQSVKL